MKTTVNYFSRMLCVFLLSAVVALTSCDRGPLDSEGKTISVSISGSAQKGQFTKGSQLTAFAVNADLVATGESFPGSISDDMGRFSISGECSAPYLELRAEGYYFNEIKGELSGPLYLEALLEPSADIANINVLTTIIRHRVKELLLAGKEYKNAVDAAQSEFLSSINVSFDQSSDFDQLDITKTSEADAFLLALSCMVQVDNSPAQVNAFLQVLADDMKDGSLSDENIALLKQKGKQVSVTAVTDNLKQFYQSKGVSDVHVPDFGKFLVSNGYAEVLSVKLLKGMYYETDGIPFLIDVSLETEQKESLNRRGYPFYFPVEDTEFSMEDPKELYGDYSFEITVFKDNIAEVTSSESWISVSEPKLVEDGRYKYVISISAAGALTKSGYLRVGGHEYEIVSRRDDLRLSECEWPYNLVAVDISHAYHGCRQSELDHVDVLMNDRRHPVLKTHSGCWLIIPEESIDTYEEFNSTSILVLGPSGAISAEIETVNYSPCYSYTTRGKSYLEYLGLSIVIDTPLLSSSQYLSLWTKLTFGGKDYFPCVVTNTYYIYAVEPERLVAETDVQISNLWYFSGAGKIVEITGLASFGYRYQYQSIVEAEPSSLVVCDDLVTVDFVLSEGVEWTEYDYCYFVINNQKYYFDVGAYIRRDQMQSSPKKTRVTMCVPASVKEMYYESFVSGLITGTVSGNEVVWNR